MATTTYVSADERREDALLDARLTALISQYRYQREDFEAALARLFAEPEADDEMSAAEYAELRAVHVWGNE